MLSIIKKGSELELYIEKLAYGGLGIGHHENIVVFVKGAIPGQTVRVKIYKKKKKYFEAYVIETIKPSKFEVSAKCTHFGVCGGCSFQNYNYVNQLSQKQDQVESMFQKLGGIENVPIEPIIGCEKQYNYRNKMEFTYSPNKWILDVNQLNHTSNSNCNALGLHVKNRFNKIVDIDNCFLHSELSDRILVYLKSLITENKIVPFNINLREGYLRNIIIRSNFADDEILINFITITDQGDQLKKIINPLIDKFKEIKSILNTIVEPNSGSSYSEREKVLWGNDYINEQIGNYTYKVSSNSFFQTNSAQAKILYDLIIHCGEFKKNEIVYDLYCGTGTIGIYIANFVKRVYGVEIVMSSIIDAIENANNNNINNIEFIQGNLDLFFNESNESKIIPRPDTIILDPPRAGLHRNTSIKLIEMEAKKIIYVSCNPSTQVRDIVLFMENGYKLKYVQPVDMFPHTPHIENIAVLTK